MRLDGLFEDLDDRDEFRPRICDQCNWYSRQIAPDLPPDDYHEAHIAAADEATEIMADRRISWDDAYAAVMRKFGYIPTETAWIKEDLDDKDEFTPTCNFCNVRTLHIVPEDMGAFHNAHMAYRQARSTSTKKNSSLRATMAKHGFVWIPDQTQQLQAQDDVWRERITHGHWVKKPLKEDLDDTDEFGSPCGYCADYARAVGDQQRFHEAHEQAEIAAERASWEVQGGWNSSAGRQKYSDIFNTMMFDLGYARRVSRGPWVDKSLKEDLDDKDEFGNPCVMCGDRIEDTEFHLAHTEAHNAAVEAVGLGRSPYFPTWIKTFKDVMAKHGYYPTREPRPRAPHDLLNGNIWVKRPLKEDLDDKDEFGFPLISAAYYDSSGGHYRYVVEFDDGVKLYAHTLPSNAGGDYFQKIRDSEGNLHGENWPGIGEYEASMGQHHGAYYKHFTSKIWADWKRAFGAV